MDESPKPNTRIQDFASFERLLLPELLQLGADVLSLRESGELASKSKSAPLDLVTAADILVEKRLVELIQTHRPGDGVAGEEGTRTDSTTGITWYIDPIDGTLNYSRGDDNFGISIGCAKNDEPLFGALYFPATGRMFNATSAVGATINSKKLITPTHTRDLNALCGDLMLRRNDAQEVAAYNHLRSKIGAQFSYNCASHAIIQVAEGKLDFAIHSNPTVYDYGAAAIIAMEAGCSVTRNFNGKSILFEKGPSPIIVTRTNEIMELIRKETAQFGILT